MADPEPKPSRWRTVAYAGGFIVAAVAFLNGVPQFVDETLPWLAERVPVPSEVPPTWWDTGAALLGIGSSTLLLYQSLRDRQKMKLLRKQWAAEDEADGRLNARDKDH